MIQCSLNVFFSLFLQDFEGIDETDYENSSPSTEITDPPSVSDLEDVQNVVDRRNGWLGGE